MLPRLILPVVIVLAAASLASAQPEPGDDAGGVAAEASTEPAEGAAPAAPGPILGYGAMPGGMQVASAEVLGAGRIGATGIAAFGYRKELLGPDHRYARSAGGLALAYSPLAVLSVGLALDGRYDRHYGLAPSGEDGYVGDPRLLVRLAKRVGAAGVGVQLGVWVPGKSAPSVAFDAITFDLRALGTFALGPARLSVNAGFRLDRSSQSIEEPGKLTLQDQVSLGVGEFDAVLGGAMLALPFGHGEVRLEGSIDQFLGDDAPGATLRGLLSAGVRLSPTASLLAFAQLASVASPLEQAMATGTVPLISYEPQINVGLGFEARFGGGAAAPAKRYVTVDNQRHKAIEVAEVAEVSGTVLDDAGLPLAGAKVTIETAQKTGTAVTDARGTFRVGELPPGAAKVSVQVAGKKPRELTLTLVDGINAAPELRLDPVLPPGELRGNVRTRAGGRAIAGAKITITPGDLATTSGSDGTFAIQVPPGKYTMTTTADGYAPQSIEAVIDQEGVTVKFVNLDKK